MSLLLLCLCGLAASLPLPSAWYAPDPLGKNWHGNQLRPDAVAEVLQFQTRLLEDPRNYTVSGVTKPWPWPRKIIKVSDYTTSGDGKDDWWGIWRAFSDASQLSQDYWNQYTANITRDPTLPLLSSVGSDTRNVLVELRFDVNGQYDLGEGIWLPPTEGYWLLFNGQNSTITWHTEPNYSHHTPNETVGVHWDTKTLFSLFDNQFQNYPRYALNFHFRASRPPTTLARVTELVQNNGKVVGMRLTAVSPHVSFNEASIKYQHVDDKGRMNLWEAPFAIYGGYAGSVTSSTPDQVGGTMVLTLEPDQYEEVGSFLKVGMYFGLVRGDMISPIAGASVAQGITWEGLGANIGGSSHPDFDLIDTHLDRLNHLMYVTFIGGGGPTGQMFGGGGGKYRFFHNSFEDGSDDNVDNLAGNSDVAEVYEATRSIKLTIQWGRWVNNTPGCPRAGNKAAISRYPDSFNYIQTLTVTGCVVTDRNDEKGQPGYAIMSVVEPVSGVKPGDVVWDVAGNPDFIHYKNYRGGNHAYNQLNVKAVTVLVEDSYMYNTTMGCIDVSTDAGYWREGNPVSNLTVRNNVFEGCYNGIQHIVWDKDGIPPSSAKSVSVVNNWFYVNSTDAVASGWYGYVPLVLWAVSSVSVVNNTFEMTPGSLTTAPLIDFCNARGDQFVTGNLVVQRTLPNGQWGGSDCKANGTQCPSYPLNKSINIVDDSAGWQARAQNIASTGCKKSQTGVINSYCNSFDANSTCVPTGARFLVPKTVYNSGSGLSSIMGLSLLLATFVCLFVQ